MRRPSLRFPRPCGDRPQHVSCQRRRLYEDTDIFGDKTDLLQAAQGQRRAADPGWWWSIASIIGPVSDGSRLAPVNEAS